MFKEYKRKKVIEARPVTPEEISNGADCYSFNADAHNPKIGDMIVKDPTLNKNMACLVSEEYFNDAYEELMPEEGINVLCDIESPPKVSVREELSQLTHDIQELSKQIDDIKSDSTCLHYDVKTAMIEVKKQTINTLRHHFGTLSMIITAGDDI